MKRLLPLFIVLMSLSTNAQETRFYLGAGWLHNAFQDANFSDVQYTKSSFLPELGYERKTDKFIWRARARFYTFNNQALDFDTINITNLGFNASVGYLRQIKEGLYLGGTLYLMDYHTRDNEVLGNNSNFYRTSSDVMLSAKYHYAFKEDITFEFGVDYSLLSFMNSAPSFTTNFPQKVVDDGEVSFQNENVRNPFNYGLAQIMPFWDQFAMRTLIQANYKNRWSMAYTWEMRSYAMVAGYPVTDAMHSLLLKYNIVAHFNQ